MSVRSRLGGWGRLSILLVLVVGVLCGIGVTEARANDSIDDTDFRIGISEMPPFTMRDRDGDWTGISYQLWDQVAKRLNVSYSLHEYEHGELYDAVSRDEVHMGLFIDPTHDHEQLIDYSRTYLHSDLAIASMAYEESTLQKVIDVLSSEEIIVVVLILLFMVIIVSASFWLLEKHDNPGLYDKSHGRGNFMNGVMWAILLVTAQEPDIFKNTSFLGRVIAMLLLLVGVTVSASYIALITSVLTVNQLSTTSYSKQDLPFIEVGVMDGSRAQEYLEEHYIKYIDFETLDEAMNALKSEKIEEILADGVELEYLVQSHRTKRVQITSADIETEYYAFSFPEESELKRHLNVELAEFVASPEWHVVLRRFLGHGTAHAP